MRLGGVPAALSTRGRAGYEAVLEKHFSGDASLMHHVSRVLHDAD